MEEWRSVRLGVLNLPSSYEVSSHGRVRSAPRQGTRGGILKAFLCPTRNGVYLKVDLRHNGRRYPRFIHRLVAIAFIPNPEQKPEVNHFDENTFHNRAGNLMRATRVEQEAHKRFMRATA